MVALEIRFLTGSFHATPWGRHVNEGEVEWPPSPWRVLRALISTWYYKAADEITDQTMCNLIEKLSTLPAFYLPCATLGHTRHYMPSEGGKTTKTFDTFALPDQSRPLLVMWHDVSLTADEQSALEILAFRLGYLGRAESWVNARLVNVPGKEANSFPLSDGELVPDGCEGVRTMACLSPQEYTEWRDKFVTEHKGLGLSELTGTSKKIGKTGRRNRLEKLNSDGVPKNLPESLFMALHADTGELKKVGWSQPPGSKWAIYVRSRDAFTPALEPMIGKTTAVGKLPKVARYSVAGQVVPLMTDAISLAERIHTALVSRSGGASVFTGHDDSGRPLKGHQHAHIFCESNPVLGGKRSGKITHVTVYAPMGFNHTERLALDGLTKVWGQGGNDIQLILLGVGQAEDLATNDSDIEGTSMLSLSRFWVSRTPFLPTRHPKSTKAGMPKMNKNGLQIGSPEHDLRRLLELAGFPSPNKVDPVFFTYLGGRKTRWPQFRHERKNGGGTIATHTGYGFRLEFASPVRGPIAVGYGAHFSMGLFIPER